MDAVAILETVRDWWNSPAGLVLAGSVLWGAARFRSGRHQAPAPVTPAPAPAPAPLIADGFTISYPVRLRIRPELDTATVIRICQPGERGVIIGQTRWIEDTAWAEVVLISSHPHCYRGWVMQRFIGNYPMPGE